MVNTWPGWESVRKLGEGSFGSVYEIQKEEYGFTQRSALKVITIPKSPADVETAYQDGMDEQSVTEYFYSFVEEFMQEIALMYKLKGNNTNIVAYEDYEVAPHDNGIGWDVLIRMELLTSLNKYASEHPLTEKDVIRLGIDICNALEICHSNGVMHRDIKPENIFFSDTGHFKLGDFGVARVAEKTLSNYSQKGTYDYMAPEVYRQEPYGFNVDMYSLGIVLYKYLNNGRIPFLPDYPEKIHYSDQEKAFVQRMSGKTPLTPPKNGSHLLKQVVLKACAFQPKDRYQKPEEFKKALEEALKVYSESPVKDEHKTGNINDNSRNEEELLGEAIVNLYAAELPSIVRVENLTDLPFTMELLKKCTGIVVRKSLHELCAGPDASSHRYSQEGIKRSKEVMEIAEFIDGIYKDCEILKKCGVLSEKEANTPYTAFVFDGINRLVLDIKKYPSTMEEIEAFFLEGLKAALSICKEVEKLSEKEKIAPTPQPQAQNPEPKYPIPEPEGTVGVIGLKRK